LEDQSAQPAPTPVTFLTTPGAEGSSASAGANAPTITCQPLSPSVHSGETASVTCTVTSPDNHPVTVAFESSRGRLQSADRSATVDTRGLNPGPLSVKAVATDDRNLSSSATTLLNVDEPVAAEATPTPAKVADLTFKRNSSYVDNRSKAVLDDVALRLQKEPTSTVVLVGSSSTGEPAGLAEQRAKNAATYLTKDKGIGPDRIQSQAGPAGPSGAAVWIVPPGATMPDLNAPVTPNPNQNQTPNLNPPDSTTPNPVQPNTPINPGATTPDTTTPPSTTTPNTTTNPDTNTTPVSPGQVLPQHRPIGPPEVR